MSLNFINKFQTRLYYILANDVEIRQFVERIYVSVVKDARQPFLLINIQKIKDLSVKAQNIYEVEFEICAFTRDRTQSLLPSLAEKVYQSLTCNNCSFDNYNVAGLKSVAINFTRSQDLISTKLTIAYKAVIKSQLILE